MMRKNAAAAGGFIVTEPQIAGTVLAAAVQKAIGAAVKPGAGDLEPQLILVAAAVGIAAEYPGRDVASHNVPEAFWQCWPAGCSIQPFIVVNLHQAGLLHAYGIVLLDRKSVV